VSRDDGASWGDAAQWAANGGDDLNLLRAIAWGNGKWVAAGWRMVSSIDGVTWVEEGEAGCNLIEGMTFGDGVFLLACCCDAGQGDVYRSTDGLTWELMGTVPAAAGRHAYVVHGSGGEFGASGDDGPSFVSHDQGLTWEPMEGVDHVMPCDGALVDRDDCFGAFRGGGGWLRTQWAGVIERSADGTSWTQVYDDPGDNTIYDGWHPAFAMGWAAPAE
jgi:hypothetical protein